MVDRTIHIPVTDDMFGGALRPSVDEMVRHLQVLCDEGMGLETFDREAAAFYTGVNKYVSVGADH